MGFTVQLESRSGPAGGTATRHPPGYFLIRSALPEGYRQAKSLAALQRRANPSAKSPHKMCAAAS
ncbi:MAG: hypothetical protein CVT75_02130 [Alphaproteobacteria bacterium HGW-Alphaproteobacteria-14]|nr:MAG: hypothetical protein CVT75_02130 [Alphaproteobacteria bacterium HGW-Alphaproteobacteria-14]